MCCCIVRGSPRMCINTTGTPFRAATSRIRGSKRSAETSFTISGPAAIANSATAAFRVSVESGAAPLGLLAPRPERIHPLINPFVAAIDLMNVVDDALAFCAERCEQERHAGANVGTRNLRAGEASAADDDGAMRIAQDDACTHLDQFVREEQS